MTNITRAIAADRIELFANENRLIQHSWHREEEGRKLACLLGAIDPGLNSPDDCPASVMPSWMAQLLPTLFDGVRAERATEYGLRFARALRSGKTDESVHRAFLVATVEVALESARSVSEKENYWPAVEKAGLDVITLLKSGEDELEKWKEVWAAARVAEAAARVAEAAAAWAAAAAAWAAEAWAAEAWAVKVSVRAAAAAKESGEQTYETLFDSLINAMQ